MDEFTLYNYRGEASCGVTLDYNDLTLSYAPEEHEDNPIEINTYRNGDLCSINLTLDLTQAKELALRINQHITLLEKLQNDSAKNRT